MSQLAAFAELCATRAQHATHFSVDGRVCALVGTAIEAAGIDAELGSLVELRVAPGRSRLAEVVGFREGRTILMPLEDPSGIRPGACVASSHSRLGAPAAAAALGRVIDGLGRPLDGGPALAARNPAPPRPPGLLDRRLIDEPLDVGVRSINALCTIGRGARIGLFSGSGVGKSTLLGQIARGTRADSIVVALVGERGREVREFVDQTLGSARSKASVVVATSDESPAMRRRAAWLAADIASGLRARGDDVLLLMDSLSRFAAAQREIGLAAGEPAATRGYPPSTWSSLPLLIEQAGTGEDRGSITGIYTVLVEGDVDEDPIADAIRSFLDGHIVLSRRLAERGQFPAIDPLASVSRVMRNVISQSARGHSERARAALAIHTEAEDLISIGAYQPGKHAPTDEAIRLEPALRRFLCQEPSSSVDLDQSFADLAEALSSVSS